MVITESERLVLRELELSDVGVLAGIWGDAHVMKYCGGTTLDADFSREVIEANRKNYCAYGYAVFAVVQKSDGTLIGTMGCKPDKAIPRRGELIYHFSEAVWGKGFASEAVASYLLWVCDNHNMDYINASVIPDNAASIRVLEKSGFVQNGFVQFEDTGFISEPFFERYFDAPHTPSG